MSTLLKRLSFLLLLPSLQGVEHSVEGKQRGVRSRDMIEAGENDPFITGRRVPTMDSCNEDYKLLRSHLILRTCLAKSISLEELRIYATQGVCPIATNNRRIYRFPIPLTLSQCLERLTNSLLYRAILIDCEIDCPKLRHTGQVNLPQWKKKSKRLMWGYYHLKLPSALYQDYTSPYPPESLNPLLPRYKRICKPLLALCVALQACYHYCCCYKPHRA